MIVSKLYCLRNVGQSQFSLCCESNSVKRLHGAVADRHAVLCPDGEGLPLTQPQPTHGTLGGGSCPGTPEMRRRQEEAMRRLASQVPHTPVTTMCTFTFLSTYLWFTDTLMTVLILQEDILTWSEQHITHILNLDPISLPLSPLCEIRKSIYLAEKYCVRSLICWAL